jgi:hypothetical protein
MNVISEEMGQAYFLDDLKLISGQFDDINLASIWQGSRG